MMKILVARKARTLIYQTALSIIMVFLGTIFLSCLLIKYSDLESIFPTRLTGNPNVQNYLALAYKSKVFDNEPKSVYWSRMAAAQGLLDAQERLGFAYKYGAGALVNNIEAAKWFKFAANQGSVPAQFALANMRYHGEGGDQDYGMAADLFKLAADQNHGPSLNNLGYFFENGIGVPKDYKIAFDLYTKSANLGVVQAMNNLGHMHKMGLGTKKNDREAEVLFAQAYEKGDEWAGCSLKKLFFNSTDNIQNKLKMWIELTEKNLRNRRDAYSYSPWHNLVLEHTDSCIIIDYAN